MYTISVEANHATTGSSTPTTIPLSSKYAYALRVIANLSAFYITHVLGTHKVICVYMLIVYLYLSKY